MGIIASTAVDIKLQPMHRFFFCFCLLDMYASNLHENRTNELSWENWECYAHAYFLHVGLGLIYYSYMLQSSSMVRRLSFDMISNIFVIIITVKFPSKICSIHFADLLHIHRNHLSSSMVYNRSFSCDFAVHFRDVNHVNLSTTSSPCATNGDDHRSTSTSM